MPARLGTLRAGVAEGVMLAAVSLALRVCLVLAIAVTGVWGGLLLWYRMPGNPAFGALVAVGFWATLALATLFVVFAGRWPWLAPYGVAFGALLAWFFTLAPGREREWAVDVSRPLRAEIAADHIVIADVRNFEWRGPTEFTPRWESRRYELADLETVDLINSYWMGPHIAHTLVSFGFRGERYVAFSAEIRRQEGEEFSNLAGFFRRYDLVLVAADERDIVRVRTNVRNEDVQLFRLRVSPAQARKALIEVLARANRLADSPAFYNTLTANCTTVLFGIARAIAPDLPFDWRVIVSGYLPDYAYDHALLDTRYSLPELRRLGRITGRAKDAGVSSHFSELVRTGVPDPREERPTAQ